MVRRNRLVESLRYGTGVSTAPPRRKRNFGTRRTNCEGCARIITLLCIAAADTVGARSSPLFVRRLEMLIRR